MKAQWIALLLAGCISATSASACLPPLPGEVEPRPLTDAEKAASIDKSFDQIVYGVVVRGSDRTKGPLFKILHVYRGTLVAGRVIPIEHGWGLDPPPCSGMTPAPPLLKGEYGVIGWRDEAADNFIAQSVLDAMFAAGYIRSASGGGSRSAASRPPRSAPTRPRLPRPKG